MYSTIKSSVLCSLQHSFHCVWSNSRWSVGDRA